MTAGLITGASRRQLCTLAGCSTPIVARGLCNKHWIRWRAHGDPAYEPRSLTLDERFWAKVNKGGPVPPHQPELGTCWLWTGATSSVGYGHIRATGRRSPMLLAHRVAYEHLSGPIPPGLNVLHRCDVPLCVRPDHLFLGTHADNAGDRARKGRSAQGLGYRLRPPAGELNHSAKLTTAQVAIVRSRLVRGDRQAAIAADLGVSRSAINLIALGKTWSTPHPDDDERIALTDLGRRALAMDALFGQDWPNLAEASAA